MKNTNDPDLAPCSWKRIANISDQSLIYIGWPGKQNYLLDYLIFFHSVSIVFKNDFIPLSISLYLSWLPFLTGLKHTPLSLYLRGFLLYPLKTQSSRVQVNVWCKGWLSVLYSSLSPLVFSQHPSSPLILPCVEHWLQCRLMRNLAGYHKALKTEPAGVDQLTLICGSMEV